MNFIIKNGQVSEGNNPFNETSFLPPRRVSSSEWNKDILLTGSAKSIITPFRYLSTGKYIHYGGKNR